MPAASPDPGHPSEGGLFDVLERNSVADDETTSQVATAEPGQPETGTTDSAVTDVSAPADEQPSATPPGDGTAAEAATASPAEAAPETSETKSRRERQRERAKAPPPAPTPSPAEIIAAHERQKERERQQADELAARHRRRAEYLGEVPADPRNPNSPTVYQQLHAEANTPIPDGDDTYYTEDTRALVRRVNAAKARLQEYDGRRNLIQAEAEPLQQAARTEALNWVGAQFEAGLTDVGLDVQAVLQAGASVPADQRMPAIVKALAAQLEAKHSPRIAELEDDLAAALAEVDTWKRRAGGEAAQVERGGVPVSGTNGALTVERYMAMTTEERRALLATPAGRAQIDAMSQGRVGAA